MANLPQPVLNVLVWVRRHHLIWVVPFHSLREENFRIQCCKSYFKWSSPPENSSWKSPLLVTTCPYHGILHTCWKYLPVSGARPSPWCYRKILESLKLKRMWVRSHHAYNLTFSTRKTPRNPVIRENFGWLRKNYGTRGSKFPDLIEQSFSFPLHRKKRFTSFPSPAGMSLTKLPLGRNNSVMTSLFLPMESLVVTSRLGTGNLQTFFLQCDCLVRGHPVRLAESCVWSCKSVVKLPYLCQKAMENLYVRGTNGCRTTIPYQCV